MRAARPSFARVEVLVSGWARATVRAKRRSTARSNQTAGALSGAQRWRKSAPVRRIAGRRSPPLQTPVRCSSRPAATPGRSSLGSSVRCASSCHVACRRTRRTEMYRPAGANGSQPGRPWPGTPRTSPISMVVVGAAPSRDRLSGIGGSRYPEPGPIVPVASAHGDERSIMTRRQHTIMEVTLQPAHDRAHPPGDRHRQHHRQGSRPSNASLRMPASCRSTASSSSRSQRRLSRPHRSILRCCMFNLEGSDGCFRLWRRFGTLHHARLRRSTGVPDGKCR